MIVELFLTEEDKQELNLKIDDEKTAESK